MRKADEHAGFSLTPPDKGAGDKKQFQPKVEVTADSISSEPIIEVKIGKDIKGAKMRVIQDARPVPAETKIEKISFWQVVKSHARRLFVELLNLFFNHDWIFWLVGLANKKLGLVESVFLAYPANDDYSDAYTYRRRARTMEWTPKPIGFLWQNGKFGIKFAVSANNGQFNDPVNEDKLYGVVERMEELRKLFRAKHKTFAGTLPGILFMKRMVRETPEADITAKVVRQVIDKVKSLEKLSDNTPIIVLGGRGFIGRRVVASLPQGIVHSVDISNGNRKNSWPFQLQGRRVLLVNISLSSVLGEYVHLLWPEVVVINEVYPEPSPELAQQLRSIGCRCYHIGGVKAGAFPSFPGGYEGGIPCCAAWRLDGLEALFKRVV